MLASPGCALQVVAAGSSVLERERDQVAAAARRLAGEGLVLGTAGNISARAGDLVAITPTGASLAELSGDEIAVVDRTGQQLSGPYAPTSELQLHLGVYDRYESGAVVHTHAPMATALSCVLDEVPLVHYQMLLLGGAIRVAPYATFGSAELADVTLDALKDRAAALMANHGAITHAPQLDQATEHALLLEWACSVYWHAAALGAPKALDSRQASDVVTAAVNRGYGSKHSVEA